MAEFPGIVRYCLQRLDAGDDPGLEHPPVLRHRPRRRAGRQRRVEGRARRRRGRARLRGGAGLPQPGHRAAARSRSCSRRRARPGCTPSSPTPCASRRRRRGCSSAAGFRHVGDEHEDGVPVWRWERPVRRRRSRADARRRGGHRRRARPPAAARAAPAVGRPPDHPGAERRHRQRHVPARRRPGRAAAAHRLGGGQRRQGAAVAPVPRAAPAAGGAAAGGRRGADRGVPVPVGRRAVAARSRWPRSTASTIRCRRPATWPASCGPSGRSIPTDGPRHNRGASIRHGDRHGARRHRRARRRGGRRRAARGVGRGGRGARARRSAHLVPRRPLLPERARHRRPRVRGSSTGAPAASAIPPST